MRDEIDKIINEARNWDNFHLKYGDDIKEVTTALFELFTSKIPKEKEEAPEREDYTGNCDDDYDSGVTRGQVWGFNACRAEFKKNIEEGV